MPCIARMGDIGSGHGSFPDTPIISGSNNAFTNGKPIARQGDPLEPHGSPTPSPPHSRSVASGSANIFINGKPMARIGDPVDCGGLIVQGSGNAKGN